MTTTQNDDPEAGTAKKTPVSGRTPRWMEGSRATLDLLLALDSNSSLEGLDSLNALDANEMIMDLPPSRK